MRTLVTQCRRWVNRGAASPTPEKKARSSAWPRWTEPPTIVSSPSPVKHSTMSSNRPASPAWLYRATVSRICSRATSSQVSTGGSARGDGGHLGLRVAELPGQAHEQLLGEIRHLAQQRAEHADAEDRDLHCALAADGGAAGRTIEDRELAEIGAFAHLGHLDALAQHRGGAVQDHEERVTRLTLDHEVRVGRERRRLHVPRDRAPLACGAPREEPDGLECVGQVSLAAHARSCQDPGSLAERHSTATLPRVSGAGSEAGVRKLAILIVRHRWWVLV